MNNQTLTREQRLENATFEAFMAVFEIEAVSYAVEDAEDREVMAAAANRLIQQGNEMLKILKGSDLTVSEKLKTLDADSV